jgi:hypothetical protein
MNAPDPAQWNPSRARRSFDEWHADPDSQTRLREESTLYENFRDMVRDMETFFKANPEQSVVSFDNLSQRRVRFCSHDRNRMWEMGISDLVRDVESLTETELEWLITEKGRSELAAFWTTEWSSDD